MTASEFTAARSAFESARRSSAAMIADTAIVLADRRVDVQVVGHALFDRLCRALSHLAPAADGGRALTVRAWDADATGVPVPVTLDDADPGPNGVVSTSADGRLLRCRRRTSIAWLDRSRGELLVGVHSADDLTAFDCGKPFHLPLAIWHADRGIPFVHAGVVGRAGRGVLFPGPGGSGKTTASLACALAGFDYIGDDGVGLEGTETGARAHSVYASANISPVHLARFPSLASCIATDCRSEPEEPKDVLLLDRWLPRPHPRAVDLAAIVVPRVAPDRPTALAPISRGEALTALAPSTVLFLPGPKAAVLDLLASVVARLPCYRLNVGARVSDIPGALASLFV